MMARGRSGVDGAMPGHDDDYEAYVKYLYERDVAPHLFRGRLRRHHPFEWYEEFEYPLERLAQANASLRLLSITSDEYETFRPKALAGVIRDASLGVGTNARALQDLGFAETIDSEYLTLARGMRPDHLPAEELEMLRRFGFPEVAENLAGILWVVREHATTAPSRNRDLLPTGEMRIVEQVLDQAAKDHDRIGEIEDELVALRRSQEQPPPEAVQRLADEARSRKKPRRWWKGLGQIVQGAGISLSDVAVVVGLGSAGVTPAWAALVSVTVGVGTIMEGIGDLRGE